MARVDRGYRRRAGVRRSRSLERLVEARALALRPDRFVGNHNGRAFYYDFAKFELQNMPSAHTPGLEIVQRVYARTASEPLCCPSWEKLSLFRYDDTGFNRYVRYDLEWIKL